MGEHSVDLSKPQPTDREQNIQDDAAVDATKPSESRRPRGIFLLLLLFFFFGVLLGALFVGNANGSILDTLDHLLFTSLKTRTQGAFLPIFIASMASSFLFMLAEFFCGLSMWGALVVPVFPLLRGFGLGLTSGYVYTFGWTGVFYHILVILPGAVLAAGAILFGAMESIRFSRQLNAAHKLRRTPNAFVPQPSIQNYILRLGLISCLTIAAALVDVVTALLFSGVFQNGIS